MIISINVIPIIIHYIYHHKSWQILSIFMEAMASELLVSYVKSHYLSFTSGAWVFVTLTNLWLRLSLRIASPSMYSELGSGETINVLSMPPKQSFRPSSLAVTCRYTWRHIQETRFFVFNVPTNLESFLKTMSLPLCLVTSQRGKGVIF